MKPIIIAAVGIDGAIGKDNDLLWHVPEDFKRYKERTTGNILIVGRKTYESLPFKALQNRTHIVVQTNYKDLIDVPNGCDVRTAYSINEAIELANELKTEEQEIFVIGGAQLYESMIDECDEAEITWINKMYEDANKHFPINKLFNDFSITGDQSWSHSDKGLLYKFTYYKRK